MDFDLLSPFPSPTQPIDPPQHLNGYDEQAEHTAVVAERTSSTSQSPRWMITLWPDNLPIGWNLSDISWPHGIEYWCWGLEICPRTGKQHYHIYCRFNHRIRFSQLFNVLPDGSCHIEMARGSEQQCRDYCWSQGSHTSKAPNRINFQEVGVFNPEQGKMGKRTDLQDIAALIDANTPMADIAKKYAPSYIRYHNGIEAYARTTAPQPPASRTVSVYVLYGPTGTGKTHRVLTAFPDACSVFAGKNPWDEYTGQTTLLLDEWRSSDWPIAMMNKLLDKWKLTLQCRYRNVCAAWTRVIICTNDFPGQFYAEEPNPLMREAFQRRILGKTYLIDKKETEGGKTLDEIMKEIDSHC